MPINTWTVSICHRTIPRVRMTHFEKWGDGSSVHKRLNKQSQEGYNLFLRLHCELNWISPVDMVSGLERDRGRTLTADVMLSHQLQDQTTDEEWPGLVPGLQAILIQWLASVPSFCCPLLLAKKKKRERGQVPTARRGLKLSFSSRFLCVFCSACTLCSFPLGQNVQKLPSTSGCYFHKELALNQSS